MPRKTFLAQFDSPIVLIQPLKYPHAGIITQDNTIYTYDFFTNVSKKIFHLNIPENKSLYCAFDFNHSRLLFGSSENHTLNLIDLNEKKVIRQFDLDQQSPSALTFSPDGHYFVCGTDQGRVLLWRCDSSALIARLHSFPEHNTFYTKPKINYVSVLTINETLLASSGYGGSIVITDYHTQNYMKRYKPGFLKNSALLFYNDYLISGNQEGTLTKIDTKGTIPNQRLTTSHTNIRYLLRVGPEPYAIVASDLPYLTLINADTFKIIHNHYLELDAPISSLCKIDDFLLIGNQSKELLRYDLQHLDYLETLINTKNYAAAYQHCNAEPLLLHSECYQSLESIYAQHLQKAKEYLCNRLTKEAQILLEPFQTVKTKEIAELFKAYSSMERFIYLFEHNNLSAFYGHAEQYPLLQETALYQQVEKIWNGKFIKAQKLMLLNKSKEAQQELQMFATVSSKHPLILLLLHNSDVLREYSKAIQCNDYYQLKTLTQRFPLLRKFPSYINFIHEAGELLDATIQTVHERSFEKAELLLNALSEVIQYESEYYHLKSFYSLAKNLNHAITHNQLRSAYDLIDSHHELLILSWAQELNAQWNEKLERAEQYAIVGNVTAIKNEFMTIINLPERHKRIGDILRTAYHVQLKKLLKTNNESFSVGVHTYCDLFGIDTELHNLIKKAKSQNIILELTPSNLAPKPRDQWLSQITKLPNKIA
jgi:hypothetical protein